MVKRGSGSDGGDGGSDGSAAWRNNENLLGMGDNCVVNMRLKRQWGVGGELMGAHHGEIIRLAVVT